MTRINGKQILILIVLIFAVWNLSWYLITTLKYNQFTEVVPKNNWGSYSVKKEDGYVYNVKKPNYLRLTGNLGVANHDKGEALIIWPFITGGYKYGIRLQKDGAVYEIYVDENMKPINKNDTVAAEKVEKYKTEIEELFSKANEMWELK